MTEGCSKIPRPKASTKHHDQTPRPKAATKSCDQKLRPNTATKSCDQKLRPKAATEHRDQKLRPNTATKHRDQKPALNGAQGGVATVRPGLQAGPDHCHSVRTFSHSVQAGIAACTDWHTMCTGWACCPGRGGRGCSRCGFYKGAYGDAPAHNCLVRELALGRGPEITYQGGTSRGLAFPCHTPLFALRPGPTFFAPCIASSCQPALFMTGCSSFGLKVLVLPSSLLLLQSSPLPCWVALSAFAVPMCAVSLVFMPAAKPGCPEMLD